MSGEQKFALVTGCGKGGIGEALVHQYARHGVHPIATVLPSESSEHLDQEGITWFPLDVTDEKSVTDLKQSILGLTGYTMTAIDTNVNSVKRMFDVNLFGPMQMVHHFHDMIIQATGTIVNIGSIGGIVPYMYGGKIYFTKNSNGYALTSVKHRITLLRPPFTTGRIHCVLRCLRLGKLKPETMNQDAATAIGLTDHLPSSVKVITGITTGSVSKEVSVLLYMLNILHLGSYYSPLAPDFKKHVQRTPETTDRFDYAANVVAQSLRPSPAAWFWYGKATSIIRFFDTFAWRTFWDYVFWREFKLEKVQKAHIVKTKKL
ncbi:hypothetical protein CP533_2049 [Ophiocordyceps camponoti-saundersi (nom. inval.)]|nr:hypothetical protein CP533_2049 [Ophiocordyceps camponoti-saundersi (nom. inval.)]